MNPHQLDKTWIEIGGQIYGAKPDETGPIGGGAGYAHLIAKGDFHVGTEAALLDALSRARTGQIIYVEPDAEIEVTARVRAEKLVLEIPAGVTLAGNRGFQGAPGGLIFSEEFATSPMIRPLGPGVRITGLRLRGPDPKRRLEFATYVYHGGGGGNTAFYRFPTSDGIRTGHAGLEVDNCEISGWSYAGVLLTGGDDHRIHHNSIHHNQRIGLGYGICVHQNASVLIEFNIFDHNKHSIAGSGMPGSGYEARHNVVYAGVNARKDFEGQSHLFDMHGGEDSWDGGAGTGDWLKIHHNLFASAEVTAIHIRGVPAKKSEIHHNWFLNPHAGPATVLVGGNTTVRDNLYGHPPRREPLCGDLEVVRPVLVGAQSVESGMVRVRARNTCAEPVERLIHFTVKPDGAGRVASDKPIRVVLAGHEERSDDVFVEFTATGPVSALQLQVAPSLDGVLLDAEGLRLASVVVPVHRTIGELESQGSADGLGQALAAQPSYLVGHPAAPVGVLRFAVAGESLAVWAEVYDRDVRREHVPWQGSCVEVFGAMPDCDRGRQLFLLPADGDFPASAVFADQNGFSPVPDVDLHFERGRKGYVLAALVPLRELGIDPAAKSFLLEFQLSTREGLEAGRRYATLFGSKSAYKSSTGYGAFVRRKS